MIKGVHLPNNAMIRIHVETMGVAKVRGFLGMTFASDINDLRTMSEVANLDGIVRLYDDRIRSPDHGVKAVNFCLKQESWIRDCLHMGIKKFAILNEPNHPSGIEGWGITRNDARRFNAWYRVVLGTLKEMFPGGEFGFPGLVPQANDLMWWDECRGGIEESDWVGFHGYWQYDNYDSRQWGMRHVYLWKRHPTKPMYVTECGDATTQDSFDVKARRLSRYATLLQKFPWIQGMYPFILSSEDPAWDQFAWVSKEGDVRPFATWMADLQPLSIAERIIHAGYLVKRNGRYPKRPLQDVKGVTIHHSGIGIPDWRGAPTIAEYHVRHYDWPGAGYTYYIDRSGAIYQLWDIERKTNHTGGHNAQWIGICLDGAFTEGRIPTDAQLTICNELIKHITVMLGRPVSGIELYSKSKTKPFLVAGHKELNDTVCPGNFHRWAGRLVG
jgi:hypothetical protein